MIKKKKAIFIFVILTIVGLVIVMTHTDASAGAPPSLTLITPYVYENDMASINESFSVDDCAPWGFGDHLGIDFFTTGVIGDPNEYKFFQSVCSGLVVSISPYYNPVGGPNGFGQHQVNVEIEYDSTYSVTYAFETWSDIQADGDDQLSNIFSHISLYQNIPQGHIIGELVKAGGGAHIHFGLRENGMDVCPEPYFTNGARNSILNVLHITFPHAQICYGLEETIPTANIIVDGNTADWSGVNVLAWDRQNDVSASNFPGADIQALYLARDATHLFLRLDLWENANPNFGNGPYYGGRYSFRLVNNGTYPDLFLSVAGGYILWSLGFNGSNGPGTPALLDNRSDLVGVNLNVIEVKIPLWIIGFPTEFQRIHAEVSDCCIDPNNVIVLDETHCASNLHTIYEPAPEESIQSLISSLKDLNIPKKIKKKLKKNLKSALKSLAKDNVHRAIKDLNAVIRHIHHINPRRGKKKSSEIADQLIEKVQRIKNIITH